MRLLIIEDNRPDYLFVQSELITGANPEFETERAANLAEGIYMLRNEHFDLIMVDLGLPDSSGLETFEQLNKEFSKIPIIVLSGLDDENIALEAVKKGAQDYLVKGQIGGNLISRSVRYAIERKNSEIKMKNLINDLTLSEKKIRDDSNKLLILNNKLKKSEKKLAELNATKDKFFSIISHDLRSPLSNFKKTFEFLISGLESMSLDELKEFLMELKDYSDNLFELLEDLLLWAQAQQGKLLANPAEYDLEDACKNALELMQKIAVDKEISISLEVNSGCNAWFDLSMIRTVIRNLVSNAIKFSHPGGEIRIVCDEIDDRSVKVSVIDSGIGIAPEHIEKMFRIDMHHTTPGTMNELGTGLGLTICREFVEQNNGKIQVESKPKEGSKFSFVLPKKVR